VGQPAGRHDHVRESRISPGGDPSLEGWLGYCLRRRCVVPANEEVIPLLASTDLFKDVPRKILKKIAAAGKLVEHQPGHEVISDGSRGAAFHLITSGGADVQVRGKPRLGLKSGDSFGEISMIDGLPRSAAVRAGAAGMTTFALVAWEFLPILKENPSVSHSLLKVLCARIRSIEQSAAE
jgi:CRP/FNR family transcriptional regulator, cyclic AMP receptor protein